MTIVKNTHHRKLNSLESQAVDMIVNGNFVNQGFAIELTLGEEDRKPFIDVTRGSQSIRIHFEEEVK